MDYVAIYSWSDIENWDDTSRGYGSKTYGYLCTTHECNKGVPDINFMVGDASYDVSSKILSLPGRKSGGGIWGDAGSQYAAILLRNDGYVHVLKSSPFTIS